MEFLSTFVCWGTTQPAFRLAGKALFRSSWTMEFLRKKRNIPVPRSHLALRPRIEAPHRKSSKKKKILQLFSIPEILFSFFLSAQHFAQIIRLWEVPQKIAPSEELTWNFRFEKIVAIQNFKTFLLFSLVWISNPSELIQVCILTSFSAVQIFTNSNLIIFWNFSNPSGLDRKVISLVFQFHRFSKIKLHIRHFKSIIQILIERIIFFYSNFFFLNASVSPSGEKKFRKSKKKKKIAERIRKILFNLLNYGWIFNFENDKIFISKIRKIPKFFSV